MIAPDEVRKFLDRRLDDFSWMKRLREADVDAAINKLTLKPKLTDAKLHQKIGFLIGVANPQFFYVYDMGTGKTWLDLKLLEYHYASQNLKHWSVILVPTDEAVLGWEDQIRLWSPKLPYRLLLGDSQQKWRALEGFERGLVVVTYIGYASMVSDIQPVRNRKTGKVKNKRVPVPRYMKEFAAYTSSLTMDESTYVGNVQSLTYETVKELSFSASVRYALAGRPFGRDPLMTWSQCFLVDHGASLSSSLGMFREAFFTKKKLFWGGPNSYEYKFDKKREADFSRALGHRSLAYSIDECVDMPERVPIISRVAFPEATEAYYQRVTQALIAARGNFREVEASFHKMRQIASGFLGFVDDESGERAQVEFKDNPKLDDLIAKLDLMPAGRKALIFYEYTWTGARICRELATKGWKHGWLWGGSTDWPQTKERFENDPDFKALVINWKKGSFSLNLQAANYIFFVESPISPINRDQCERRPWRQGQTRTVYQYDIIVRGSVEERILKFHKEGQDLMRDLVADPKKVLEL